MVTCICIDLVASVAVHFGPLQITVLLFVFLVLCTHVNDRVLVLAIAYVLQTCTDGSHDRYDPSFQTVASRVYRTDRYIDLSWLLRAGSRRELINNIPRYGVTG